MSTPEPRALCCGGCEKHRHTIIRLLCFQACDALIAAAAIGNARRGPEAEGKCHEHGRIVLPFGL